MLIDELKETQQAKVIKMAGELWNELLLCGLEQYDINVANENIHRIQDMLYTKLFIDKVGKL